MGAQETQQVVRMLLFNGEYLFDEVTSRWICVSQPSSYFGVDLDCDSLGDQVLAQQVHERCPVRVLRMGTLGEGGGVEVRLSLQLHNTGGNPVGVLLFLFCVFQEFLGYRFRGKAMVELMILAPIIVPGIAVALGLQTVFIGLGLNNTVTGVVLVHLIPTLPYMVLVMASVFAAYDPLAEDQARSLGASPAQVFRHITLPTILPGVVVGAMFTFLVSWGQYILTLTIGGGRVQTLPLIMFQFVASGRNDITGAIAMIYILPGVLIVALTARSLTGRSAAMTGLSR